MSLAGSTYTLLRDIYGENLTISNNSILKPEGFRIYVRGVLQIEAGSSINDDGNPAAGGTGGAGLPQGGPARFAGSGAGGTGGSGFNGGSGAGAPGWGNSGCPPSISTYDGGDGGISGTGQFGGQGPNPYPLPSGVPAPRTAAWYDYCILFYGDSGGLNYARLAQGSGGGGGGGQSGSTGGGGGGGGGGIMISAWEIDNAGTISANGGDGDNGAGPGGAGGGGGGSGGYVAIMYSVESGSGLGTIQANGGALGQACANGGSPGQAGDNGPVLILQETD